MGKKKPYLDPDKHEHGHLLDDLIRWIRRLFHRG